jgi:hypothetical protein
MLGSGENVAYVYDRGGMHRLARLEGPTSITWGRVRDDISEAKVVIINPTGACCAALTSIAVGRHELVIFRNGERVWEGPITRTSHSRTTVEVFASDINHYLTRLAMRRAYDNRYAKKNSKVGLVTTRLSNILLNELARREALDPPVNILPYLTVYPNPKGAKTSRFTPAYKRTVWEEMDSLAWRAGIDYTAVGRRLIINDVHEVIGRTPALSQDDFQSDLIVSSYGMELASRAVVSDGDGHWAAVGGTDAFYGEVEILNDLYDVSVRPADPTKPTKTELKALAGALTSQAQPNLAGRYPTPVVARIPDNSALDPRTPLGIEDLVPGVRVPLRANLSCLSLEQEQKLDRVTVTQTDKGETITVTLSPAPGVNPWDGDVETSGDDLGEEA